MIGGEKVGRYSFLAANPIRRFSAKRRQVEVVDLASNPDCLAPAGAEIEGEFVITTESGDHITGDYKTVAQIDAAANRITALGHYRVTGGTGRFTRAKGRGVIKADGNFQPPFDLTGELIAQPASGDDDDD